jgi:hypothetical protein
MNSTDRELRLNVSRRDTDLRGGDADQATTPAQTITRRVTPACLPSGPETPRERGGGDCHGERYARHHAGRNARDAAEITSHELPPRRYRLRLLPAGHRDQRVEHHGGRHAHRHDAAGGAWRPGRGRGVLPASVGTDTAGRTAGARWALFAFISVFALINSLRMASVIAADQAMSRSDRQTEGVKTADHALDVARASREAACGRGLGKTVACKTRQAEVAKFEVDRRQATAKVAAQAKPEGTDFAKLVTWLSRGSVQPGADDFTMIWLLFRTFLPQVGGLVLMLAGRR